MNPKLSNLVNSLNQAQSDVVYSDSSRLLCMAGAGTGKTHTMITRILRLVDEGVNPNSILCLTFTNAAASEMESRYILNSDTLVRPYFGTFHAFCYWIMGNNFTVCNRLGYENLPKIIDEYQESMLLEKAKMLSSVKIPKYAYSIRYKPKPKEKFEYKVFQKTVDKLLKGEGLITFDRLCYHVCELFEKKDPSVIQYFNQFRYVMVDEFQDTDPLQWQFVKSFEDSKIMIVGDIRQSLYAFRGADSSIIKGIAKDESWDVIKLEENYRSTIEICNNANRILDGYNDDVDDIALVSQKHGPGVRHLSINAFKNNLKVMLADECSDIALLARTNREVGMLRDLCKQAMIPYILKTDNSNEQILSSALNDKIRVSYLISLLPKEIQQEALRKLYLQDNFDLEPLFQENLAEIVMRIEAIKESENFSEILYLLETNQMNVQEIANNSTMIPKIVDKTVYIGTIHSVKGLEFDSVFVYGVNNNRFDIDNEDMRNLYYVASTRPKTYLTIVS